MFFQIAQRHSLLVRSFRPQLFKHCIIPASRPYSSIPQSNNVGSKSLKERLTAFFKQYGKLGVAVYLGVSVTTFGTSYLALRSGFDLPGLLIKLGVPEKDWMKNAGTLAFAYALYKLALPLRLFVTVSLTGFIARRLRIKGK